MKLTAEKIAGLFGVEVGEWFVAHNHGHNDIECRIDEKCAVVDRGGFEIDLNWLVTTEISKLPWKPKNMDNYFFPAPNPSMVTSTNFYDRDKDDQWRVGHGLCFKTQGEAEAKWRELYGVTE